MSFQILGSFQLIYTVSMNLHLPSQFQTETRNSAILYIKFKVLKMLTVTRSIIKPKSPVLRLINMYLNTRERSKYTETYTSNDILF